MFVAPNREGLARALALPMSAVTEDQSLVGEWRPVILSVEGPITTRKVRQLENQWDKSNKHRAYLLGKLVEADRARAAAEQAIVDSIAEQRQLQDDVLRELGIQI